MRVRSLSCGFWGCSIFRKLNCMWNLSRVSLSTTIFFYYNHVSDLVNATTLLFALLYVDNSSLFFNRCKHQIDGDEFAHIAEWLQFTKVQQLYWKPTLTKFLVLENVRATISQYSVTKFLGVMLDLQMTWSSYIHLHACSFEKNTFLVTLYYFCIYWHLAYLSLRHCIWQIFIAL